MSFGDLLWAEGAGNPTKLKQNGDVGSAAMFIPLGDRQRGAASELRFPHSDDSSCFPKLSSWVTAVLENHLPPWTGIRGTSDLSTHKAISCQSSTAMREGYK